MFSTANPTVYPGQMMMMAPMPMAPIGMFKYNKFFL